MSDTKAAGGPPQGAPMPGGGPMPGQITSPLSLVFGGILLTMLLAALDQTIVSTALPTMAGTLGGVEHLSWVVTAYLLGSTASTPLWGAIGDMRGRKPVLMTAIAVFLIGSAACGMVQNMGELIAFRGLQGIGAGGLMAMAMAVVADVVPPRERGRYQGYIQAVFALASVGGPLIGGVFTEHASWRWVFYVNLPVGLVALAVLGVKLRIPVRRSPHRVDYLGAALLVGAVTSLMLGAVWGGSRYAWGSAEILGLGAAFVVLLAVFVWWERKAAEPILPPSLFQDRVVLVVSVTLFIATLAFFAVTVFLPLYLQLVQGVGATNSGLLLLPMLLATIAATMVSGRIMFKTGKYKIFPVLGMALVSVGMVLLATLDTHSSRLLASAYMVLVGLGFGLITQVLIVAIQNAVPRQRIGTATAGANFFRSLGGSVGVAVFGAVFTSGVNHWLPKDVPGDAARSLSPAELLAGPEHVRAFSPAVRAGVGEAVSSALHPVFWVALPLALLGLATVLFLKEAPLAMMQQGQGQGQGKGQGQQGQGQGKGQGQQGQGQGPQGGAPAQSPQAAQA